MRILVINPGSTSTRVALFEDEVCVHTERLAHDAEELEKAGSLWGQFELRKAVVLGFLAQNGIDLASLDAVVGRGGLLKPLPGGTYLVNEAMIEDARKGLQGEHVSNLGCALAKAIADEAGCPAYVVDPVSVDEFEPLARYSGHPRIERRALSHSLSIHAVARRAAQQLGLRYELAHFVVAHLGGGISVAPVRGGRIIDVNDASSDGPFSPERTGGLPLQPFITLCYSGEFREDEMRRFVMGKGGLVAYLGTNNAVEVERRILQDGDLRAREVYEAMAYQIAKEIGAMATVLKGQVDAIVLTGGLASSDMLCTWIAERVSFIARVLRYPGEFEMEAMAEGALRVLRGEEQALSY
ncbi:MAG: butyrate kinase [candidate division KSB1 bacterium]|nr:butyrate kinase [candidate division KSB1 bacterium]